MQSACVFADVNAQRANVNSSMKLRNTKPCLHPRYHTDIVHCVSQIPTVSNLLYHRFTGFLSTALLSSSTLVRSIFNESVYFTYSSTGYNFRYGYLNIKAFCIPDFNIGSTCIIRQIC